MTSKGLPNRTELVLVDGDSEGYSLDALEASELRYRRLFETAQDGILILDGQTGRIIDVNPFLLDLLEYPFNSIVGLELESLIPQAKAVSLRQMRA